MIGSLWTDANSGSGQDLRFWFVFCAFLTRMSPFRRSPGSMVMQMLVWLSPWTLLQKRKQQQVRQQASTSVLKLWNWSQSSPSHRVSFFWCCSHDPHRQLTIPYLLQQRPSQSVNHGAALGWVRVLVSTWLCSRESGIKERRVLMGIMWEEVGRNMIRGDRFTLSYCVGCKRVYSVDTFVRIDVE